MTESGLYVDVRATVNDFVLNCQFEVPAGSSMAVVGPNGSGKSTLLGTLAGLIEIDRGKAEISGHVLFDSATNLTVPSEKRNVALVPQKATLFPHMTVADNVRFGLRYRPTPVVPAQDGSLAEPMKSIQDSDAAVSKVLNAVGLGRLRDHKPSQLSGGQQQRAALARAIVVQPHLLLADEPLSNVDAESRQALRLMMDEWKPARQVQVIVTHGGDHANAADFVLAMEGGRSVAFGSPGELSTGTKLDWLRDLLGSSD